MNQHALDMTTVPAEFPRTVLLGPYYILSWLYMPMMTYMRERWGTRFVILIPPNTDLEEQYRPYCGPEGIFIHVPGFEETANDKNIKQEDIAGIFEEARANEEHYSVHYTIDIYQQERSVASGFVSGTSKSPFISRNPLSFVGLARASNFYFRFYEELFARFNFDAALIFPRTAAEAVCATVATKHGVPVTYPCAARHKNLVYWAFGTYCDKSQHRMAYEAMGEGATLPDVELVPAGAPVSLDRRTVVQRHSWKGALKQTFALLKDHVAFLLLDLRKTQVRFDRWINSIRTLRTIWREQAHFQKFVRLCECDFGKITARPFVFFAFHMEPEFATQARCKEFNDQGAIVRQLALSLPAGMNLIIKEHAWFAGHRVSFYSDLVALPNVIMAHPGIQAVDLIPKAAAVVTLGGTVALEAALFGKPALIFADRSEVSLLPNVTVIRSLGDMPRILQKLKPLSVEEAANSNRAAKRLLSVIEAIGVEASPFFTKEKKLLDHTNVERATHLLLDVLRLIRSPKPEASRAERVVSTL